MSEKQGYERITIFLIVNNQDRVQLIENLIKAVDDFELVATTISGIDGLAKVKELKPNIVILDTNLADFDGLKISALITKAVPTSGVIIVSESAELELMNKAMLAGARWFLTMPIDSEVLLSTIRSVYMQYAPIRSLQSQKSLESNYSVGMGGAPPPTTKVLFTAFAAPEIRAEGSYSLLLYAHTDMMLDAVLSDVVKFRESLGDSVPEGQKARQTTQLIDDTPITIVPECAEIEFEPERLTKRWRGNWLRFLFDFVPSQELVGEPVLIRISIQVAHIEIASIKIVLNIVSKQQQSAEPVQDANPLMRAKLQSESSGIYHRIFISYSRKDTAIAEAYRLAQMAAGNEVFMDTHSIRTGENWQARLARAIDEADIFQLFWSENSAGSPNCHDEWDYALKYKCPQDLCATFIRPVYWQQPIIPPPDELSHLNFRYVSLTDDKP